MASSLKVNRVVPSTGTNIGLGTANGQIRLASTSKLTWDGDTNTYINHPSADTITAFTAGSERVRIQADGGVAVGTNAVSAGDLATGSTIGLPKLHVDCGHLGNGAYHIARFRAGSDNDWNAAVLTINHSNDRGIAIYGGRSSGNASWGAIKAIDNQGRLTNAFEIVGAANNGVEDIKFYTGASTTTTERIRITSAGKVGIGTDNPSQKVSIASGRVSIDVKNDYYGVWADGDTQGENHISVGRWYNTGGGLKSGYSQYGINNLILENNHPTAAHTLIIQPKGQKVAIGTHLTTDELVHIKGDVNVTGDLKSNNLPGRNIIVNGAMQVAQRKPSGEYTGQAAYATVDRMRGGYSVPNTDPITECHVLTSGDTGPWEKGFRKSYRMKIGYQSGTAAGYFYQFQYRIEAQDIANSGWDYTSSSSYITLSFWVKSSIAYNPSWYLRAKDGTEKIYRFQPGTLTANTWTKVTKTIPGNSGLTFNDDNGEGMQINLSPYWGTTYSSANPTMDAWENWDGGSRAKDTVATWFTTNGSTMEITGLQLEVGSIATEFEHLPYAEHLRRCQRYYQQVVGHSDMVCVGPGRSNGTTNAPFSVPLSVPLAKSPTINSCNWSVFTPHVQANINNHTPAVTKWDANNNVLVLQISGLSGMTNGRSLNVFLASGHTLQMDSEL